MGKTVLFIGRASTLYTLKTMQFHFSRNNFQIFEAESVEEAEKILIEQKINVCVVLAYGALFNKFIDGYDDTLPPVVYWHVRGVDDVPTRPGVKCVENGVMPMELYRLACELLK